MSFRGFIREIIEVSQAKLNEIAQECGSIRVGATEQDPHDRADQYESEGYSYFYFILNNKKIRHTTSSCTNPL